jgi:hypothetical protein
MFKSLKEALQKRMGQDQSKEQAKQQEYAKEAKRMLKVQTASTDQAATLDPLEAQLQALEARLESLPVIPPLVPSTLDNAILNKKEKLALDVLAAGKPRIPVSGGVEAVAAMQTIDLTTAAAAYDQQEAIGRAVTALNEASANARQGVAAAAHQLKQFQTALFEADRIQGEVHMFGQLVADLLPTVQAVDALLPPEVREEMKARTQSGVH